MRETKRGRIGEGERVCVRVEGMSSQPRPAQQAEQQVGHNKASESERKRMNRKSISGDNESERNEKSGGGRNKIKHEYIYSM